VREVGARVLGGETTLQVVHRSNSDSSSGDRGHGSNLGRRTSVSTSTIARDDVRSRGTSRRRGRSRSRGRSRTATASFSTSSRRGGTTLSSARRSRKLGHAARVNGTRIHQAHFDGLPQRLVGTPNKKVLGPAQVGARSVQLVVVDEKPRGGDVVDEQTIEREAAGECDEREASVVASTLDGSVTQSLALEFPCTLWMVAA